MPTWGKGSGNGELGVPSRSGTNTGDRSGPKSWAWVASERSGTGGVASWGAVDCCETFRSARSIEEAGNTCCRAWENEERVCTHKPVGGLYEYRGRLWRSAESFFLPTSATINQGLDGEKMIWTTSNGLELRRSDIMDTPRRSIHLGMMITTAIPGMFATPIPTCDRSADHNDDQNINCENMTPTPRTITTMILIAITIPIPAVIGMLIPRMIAISTQEVMTAPISKIVTITISVRITIVDAALTSISISGTWHRLSGTPELMAFGSQCQTFTETQEMPDLLTM
ncbi:unnamed protein product [Phytophthora fragariaefolia]|uniref:Unnamed protein product n=1 Tax=Phytophthora fragariaefolia TaxID=1490495 RepID=A0A9W6Y7Z7_9STRA|nr:unnamed protein product [Phytophthora fragariaefolia]